MRNAKAGFMGVPSRANASTASNPRAEASVQQIVVRAHDDGCSMSAFRRHGKSAAGARCSLAVGPNVRQLSDGRSEESSSSTATFRSVGARSLPQPIIFCAVTFLQPPLCCSSLAMFKYSAYFVGNFEFLRCHFWTSGWSVWPVLL